MLRCGMACCAAAWLAALRHGLLRCGMAWKKSRRKKKIPMKTLGQKKIRIKTLGHFEELGQKIKIKTHHKLEKGEFALLHYLWLKNRSRAARS